MDSAKKSLALPFLPEEEIESFVTPDKFHRVLRERIVAHRKDKLKNQRHLRKEVNRLNRLS